MIAREAGERRAAKYGWRFEAKLELVLLYPRSGPWRPKLGPFARAVTVRPYVLIYDFVASLDEVTLLRVLHNRQKADKSVVLATDQDQG